MYNAVPMNARIKWMNAVVLTEHSNLCKKLFGEHIALTFGIIIAQSNQTYFSSL